MSRSILIGATGAVGGALAYRLAATGRPLHLIGRKAAAVQALAADIPCATSAVADVLDDAALAAAITAAGSEVDALAFCVGSIVLKPLARATIEEFALAYQLNVIAAARAVTHALPALRASGGAVVLFSSVAAGVGFASHAIIGSAKAAVEGLTLALAAELAPTIRVNCIAPSLTRSKMATPMTSNDVMARAIAATHPIPRLGVPDDAAALAAFLLGPEAGWITGQVIGVDGGRAMLRTR